MSAFNKFIFLMMVLFVVGLFYYSFYDTSFACYDGRNPPLIFIGAPVDRMQIGVSPEGYPISCDGVVHPDAGCSFTFSGLCMVNASR